MMWLFSKGFELLAGPLLGWVTAPLAGLALVTMVHTLWERRDARLLKEGQMICERNWERKIRDEERLSYERKARAERQVLMAERRNSEELGNELETLRKEMAVLRATDVSPSDDRCLSDRVLDALED
ncbi:MAG: hypothetical protein AAFY06_00185 [Pseudomonadota bacterium]